MGDYQMSRKWKPEYRMTWRFDRYSHNYTVIGAKGAISLHITSYTSQGEEQYSAGLEYHHREPIDGRAPDHDHCYLLKTPCWHEGTSLWAQEHWMPLHQSLDPQQVLAYLQAHAEKHFNSNRSDEDEP